MSVPVPIERGLLVAHGNSERNLISADFDIEEILLVPLIYHRGYLGLKTLRLAKDSRETGPTSCAAPRHTDQLSSPSLRLALGVLSFGHRGCPCSEPGGRILIDFRAAPPFSRTLLHWQAERRYSFGRSTVTSMRSPASVS